MMGKAMANRYIPISEPPREPGFCWLLTDQGLRLLGGYTTDRRWVVLSVHTAPTDVSITCTHYIPFDVRDIAPEPAVELIPAHEPGNAP